MHRDLKPENIVMTDDCDITILDLGLSRSLSADTNTLLSDDVQTLSYRAPEILRPRNAKSAYDKRGELGGQAFSLPHWTVPS